MKRVVNGKMSRAVEIRESADRLGMKQRYALIFPTREKGS